MYRTSDWLLAFYIIYGTVALLHILIQMYFAHRNFRKQETQEFIRGHSGFKARISCIVPSYNEDLKDLKECIDTILNQRHVDLEVIVVDDFSDNREEAKEKVFSYYTDDPRVTVLFPDHNQGKRRVQKLAFDIARGEVFVTVDSDTVFPDPYAFEKLIQYFADEKVGAIAGSVEVRNKEENILTRMIAYRYWNAFNQERAAQSYFNHVLCCSGPFAAYRREIIDRVKEEYISQKFLGLECTYGDDRHMTNMILRDGWKVLYNPSASSLTDAPSTIKKFVKQQTRWNKSFYREMLWTIKYDRHLPLYLKYDMTMQIILPFLMVFVIISALFFRWDVVLQEQWGWALKYLLTIAIIGFFRASYAILRTKDLGFLWQILYGFMSMFILIPVRFWALFHLKDRSWGTRSLQDINK